MMELHTATELVVHSNQEFVAVEDFSRFTGMTTEEIKCEAMLFARGDRQVTLAYIQAAFTGQRLIRVGSEEYQSLS